MKEQSLEQKMENGDLLICQVTLLLKLSMMT